MRHVFVLSAILLLGASPAIETATPATTIAANPSAYNEQPVEVVGTVTELRVKTSALGNDYVKFKLCATACLSVFTFGRPPISNGKVVDVRGVYVVMRRLGNYTFYNEIDAISIQ
jgi:hypothetical protein